MVLTRGQVTVAATAGSAVDTALRGGALALCVDGDLRASRRLYDAAYVAAERDGDAEAMAQAALGLGGLWVHEHRSIAAASLVQSRQRRAASLVDPRSAVGLRLRVRMAGEADYVVGEHERVMAVLDEARRFGDPVARADALSLAHHCVLGPDHGALRRGLAQELTSEAARTQRRSDLLMGVLWHTVDLFLDDDPHAGRRLEEMRGLLAQREHLALAYVVRAIEVMLAIRAGRLDDAETMSKDCAELGSRAGDLDATGWYGGQLVAVRWFQGRIGELVPMLTDLVHSPTLSAVDNSYFAALAVAAATAGHRRAAVGALARLGDLAELPRSSSWLITMYGVVEAAHQLGDEELSAQAYALLRPYAHLPMMASLAVACFGSVRHALGVASLTTGDLDDAVEQLSAAVQHNLAMGHWPAVAASRRRLGQALSLRGGPGDAPAAAEAYAAAVDERFGVATPADATVDAPRVVCRRRGRQWHIDMGRRTAIVEHSVGMLHLATLLDNPGHEIPSVDLAAGAGLPRLAAGATASNQPVLDDVAKREYRKRLAALQADIDEMEALNDDERAAQARAERDWLLDELAAATGVGGRSRQFAGGEERARIAVGKAIRRALARIAEADPAIGEELRVTVQTGLRCCYRPI